MVRIDTHHHVADSLEDFAGFGTRHLRFGLSVCAVVAAQYFAAGLASYPGIDADTRAAIDRTNALALFPRFGS